MIDRKNKVKNLYTKFERNVCENWNSFRDQRVLLAVSGGLDSVVLFHLSLKLAKKYSVRFGVIHINHNLRPAAGQEAEFVARLCGKYQIAYYLETLDPGSIIKGISIEAWGRTERYTAFQKIADQQGYNFIATAHHLNDHVETVLMHIGDGCGIDGLKGIRTQIGAIVRPLLPFSRAEIRDFARENNIDWMEDPSNNELRFRRNRYRHEIVAPWLEAENGLLKAVNFLSSRAVEMDELIAFSAEKIADMVIRSSAGKSITLVADSLKSLPVLLQVGLIRKIADTSDQSWRRHRWNNLIDFIKNATTGRFLELTDGWVILRNREDFILTLDNTDQYQVKVKPGTDTHCGNYILKWREVQAVKQFTDTPWSEYIDASFLKGKTLILRNWLPGDHFRPLGMGGTKKISDLLIDARVDRFQKAKQLILEADNEIIWVCGRRLSDLVKITSATKSFVELTIERYVGE